MSAFGSLWFLLDKSFRFAPALEGTKSLVSLVSFGLSLLGSSRCVNTLRFSFYSFSISSSVFFLLVRILAALILSSGTHTDRPAPCHTAGLGTICNYREAIFVCCYYYREYGRQFGEQLF